MRRSIQQLYVIFVVCVFAVSFYAATSISSDDPATEQNDILALTGKCTAGLNTSPSNYQAPGPYPSDTCTGQSCLLWCSDDCGSESVSVKCQYGGTTTNWKCNYIRTHTFSKRCLDCRCISGHCSIEEFQERGSETRKDSLGPTSC